MALPGFELLYGSLQIRNIDDATVAAVHWNLIANGFKCCGIGETWPTDQVSLSNKYAGCVYFRHVKAFIRSYMQHMAKHFF